MVVNIIFIFCRQIISYSIYPIDLDFSNCSIITFFISSQVPFRFLYLTFIFLSCSLGVVAKREIHRCSDNSLFLLQKYVSLVSFSARSSHGRMNQSWTDGSLEERRDSPPRAHAYQIFAGFVVVVVVVVGGIGVGVGDAARCGAARLPLAQPAVRSLGIVSSPTTFRRSASTLSTPRHIVVVGW